MRRSGPEITDRERILLTIIDRLQSTILLKGHLYNEADFLDSRGEPHVHFAHYRDPRPGDLVLCYTGRSDEWKVAWFVTWKAREHGVAILREIGSDRECVYGNEKFLPVVGLHRDELLERDRYELLQKVHEAFRRGNEWGYRYGGLEFLGKHDACVWVRAPFADNLAPFPVYFHWTRRTSVAAILREMKAAGYGTRQFDRKEAVQ